MILVWKGYGHSMMNLVYLRMMFFSVRMKSEVGPEAVAAATAEDTGRFDPIPPTKLVADPALLLDPLFPPVLSPPPPPRMRNDERDDVGPK